MMTMQQQEEEEQQQQQQQQPLLPVGYKFRPTDWELLFHFLKNKLKDPTMFQPAAPIYDIQLYDHHPNIILDNFGVQGHNNNVECYVFTMRHRKFLSGNRASRILKDNVGYWRASYNHGDQFQERRQGGLVGERMNLVYYDTTTSTTMSTDTSNKKKGTKKGTKTDWLMNEYKIKPADNNDGAEEDLVLCRIYFNNRQRNRGISNHQQQQQYYNMQEEQQDMQQQQQQQQEQQPAAVDDQASNTGTYSVDTKIDADTSGELMSQAPEPQQNGAGIFLPEQPHLQQQQKQQQEQQPAAVDDQASNTGTYSIDTEIDADTFGELMSQAPGPQQTGAGIFLPEGPEQPHLHQLQQNKPAAMDDQAAANTGIYSIDADTFWGQLMSQPPEPQQTGMDMISIDDYA